MAKFFKRFICSIIAFVFALSSFSVCAFASTSYISEITLASGVKASSNLEKQGYDVLFQGMNIESDNDSTIYLGYKMGSSPITNLVVSTEKSGSITVDDVSYSLVSGINLNQGTDGTAIYLYYTKDKSAGDPITSLDTESGFTKDDAVFSLRNDGSYPVRMDDGKLANFDKGISGNALYVLMYKDGGIKQYISNAYVITGSSKSSTVNSAVAKGCNYYIDRDLTSGEGWAFIAYERTADKSKAITGLTVKDGEIEIQKNENASSYLIDIAKSKLFDESFTLGDWAPNYIAKDKNISKLSSAYNALEKSTDACSIAKAGDSKIYALYLGEYNGEVVEETTQATTQGEVTTTEEATDEYIDVDKGESTTQAQSDDEEVTASVFTTSNIWLFIVLAIVILLVIIGVIIYYRKGKKNNEKKQ